MTDAQIFAIAIMVLTVLAGTFYNNARIGDNNSRISELGTRFDRRIDDMRDVLRGETDVLRAEMKAQHAEVMHRIEKMDENIARVLADHEHRITRLEGRG